MALPNSHEDREMANFEEVGTDVTRKVNTVAIGGTAVTPSQGHDLDSGAGTEINLGVSLRTAASGGSAAAGVEDNPLVTAQALVPEEHDYIAITYVAAGNGIGEIETVTYKEGGSGGTTVATLTLAYDANDKLSTVTRT